MVDPPRYPATGDDPDETREGTPRWVYALIALGVLVVVLFVVLHLTGVMGPGSH